MPVLPSVLPSDLAPIDLAATFAALVLLVAAVAKADWRRFANGDDAHLFWGGVTAIALLRALGSDDFAGVHLLGAAIASALFGLRIAVVALALGVALQLAADGLPWTAWAGAWLLGGVTPAVLARIVMQFAHGVDPRLGPLPAIVAAFVGGGLSMLAALGLQAWAGVLPASVSHDASQVAALAVVLAIAEAQLAAIVLTLVAVQRPGWVGQRRTR